MTNEERQAAKQLRTRLKDVYAARHRGHGGPRISVTYRWLRWSVVLANRLLEADDD